MQRKIKTTNINLDPSIEEYLDKRLGAIEKLIDCSNPTLLVEIELAKTTNHHQSGDIFRAELNLTIDGEHFRAEAERIDLNSAIDMMRDEILNELRSYKGKRQSLIKRSGAKVKAFLRRFYK
jgi:ribosomal subunit interface protein